MGLNITMMNLKRLLREEQGHYGQQDLSTFQDPQEDEEDLQGNL